MKKPLRCYLGFHNHKFHREMPDYAYAPWQTLICEDCGDTPRYAR